MGTILLVLLLAWLGLTGGLGLVLRFRRCGAEGGLMRPALRLGPWFVVLSAVFLYLLAGESWWLLYGGLLGAALFLLSLGWDEFYDRICSSFYACVRRETHSFFSTPIPYFVLFLFVSLCGLFFWGNLKASEVVSLRYVFDSVSSLCIFLFPLLTMGLFARERSESTIEVLMTAPVSDAAVTVAKFLGAMSFYLVMLVPTVVYYVILKEIGEEIGKPDPGPVVSAYLGMVLMGGFFLSLGLFTSSITSSQILAALLGWVLIILFFLSSGIAEIFGLSGTVAGDILKYLDPLQRHLRPFLGGVIHPMNVIYFLSFTVFFLFLSVRMIESRKWR